MWFSSYKFANGPQTKFLHKQKFALFNSLQFLMIIACLKFVYIDNLYYMPLFNFFFLFFLHIS